MSRYETMTLGSIGLICLAWSGFVMGMTKHGLLADPGPAGVGRLLLVLILALILTHAGLWMIAWARKGRDAVPDEREQGIERLADRAGYWLTDAGIFALIVMALAEASVPGRFGSFGLTTPQGLIFALVTLNFIVGVGRLVVAFVLSRQVRG